MRRGPKPKSAADKLQAGNPGRRPLNDSEPEPKPGRPECPPEFEGLALEAWDWLCETLDAMGLLVKSDVALMALYCDAWADFWKAREEVEDGGLTLTGTKGGDYVNPAYNVKTIAKNQLAKYAVELGLSHPSRTRLHAAPDKKPAGDPKGKFFPPKLHRGA